MASIFGKKDEDLQEVLSIFTRIADGHGLESDSGACGTEAILVNTCLP